MPSSDPEAWFDGLREALREHDRTRPAETQTDTIRARLQQSLASTYELGERLGEGAAALVYRAWDRTLGRPAAIKVLRDSESTVIVRERFRREALLAACLDHPNVVRVHDSGEADELLYLVMELVEGTSLKTLLDEGRREPCELLRLLADAAQGVAEAHRRRIVHRDLKPANILVSRSGEAKVADFGLARAVEGKTALTQTGAVLGTPQYMAPEQAAGRIHDITPRTDVYALGAILYEILTRRPPHTATTLLEFYGKIVNENIVPPRAINPSVAPELEAIARKALEKNPSWRYADAAAFAADLDRHLAGQRILGQPVGATVRTWHTLAQHRRASLAAALACVAIVGALLLYVRARSATEAYYAAYQAGMELWGRAVPIAGNDRGEAPIVRDLMGQAIADFERAAQCAPNRPEPWLMIGRCHLLSLRGEDAERAWTEALRRDANFAPARLERGRYYLTTYARLPLAPSVTVGGGKVRFGPRMPESDVEHEWRLKGEEDLAKAGQAPGLGRLERRYLQGLVQYGAGHFPQAAEALRDYASANLWDFRARVLLGYALYYVADFQGAVEQLTIAIERERRPQVLRARADARFCVGQFRQALGDYDESLKAESGDADLVCNRALALKELGRLEEAEASLGRAVQMRDGFARAFNARGTVRVLLHNLDGAVEDFEQAIFHGPTYADAYANLGNVLLLRGDVDQAISEFTTALGIDPGHMETYITRGNARQLKGDAAGALQDFQEALRRDAGNADARYFLARALYAQGNKPEALRQLRETLNAAAQMWPRKAAAEQLLQAWSKE